jgi:GDP/UDP-N,N'-diacetylbacillosamine 2-epimerase (hydrolysing)
MKPMVRTVHFLTAARSDYDLLFPVIEAARVRPELETAVIVGAAHLSPFHGLSVEQIRADGVAIFAAIESLVASESWQARALSFAHLCEGLSRALADRRPDILCVAGDREEALAGALVATFLRIPVAHLHGGDRCIASDIDEMLRPAISKLAQFHFVAMESHRERLVRMGEAPERVFTTGATGLDRLRAVPQVPARELAERYGIDVERPFFLVIYHPVSTMSPERSGEEVQAVLDGVLPLGHPVLCSYPNADPGNVAIRRALEQARGRHANLRLHHNLPRADFVSLYRRCAAIIGNSSAIVIESGFLRVPGILVGRRQDLRETGPNVLRVEAAVGDVHESVLTCLENREFQERVRGAVSLYGDGHAAPRVAAVLAEAELRDEDLRKTMPY